MRGCDTKRAEQSYQSVVAQGAARRVLKEGARFGTDAVPNPALNEGHDVVVVVSDTDLSSPQHQVGKYIGGLEYASGVDL